jgi:hypothetical protein
LEGLIQIRKETYMTQRLKFASLILLAGAAGLLAPAARADEWDKLTVLTFNEPVEVPGKILPAGTYVFKLADSESDRNIVQVFTGDQKHLLATVMAIPDSRTNPTDKTVITFEERPSGSPEALHAWFYPGDTEGVEFVYPKSEQEFAATSEQPPPPAITPASAAPDAPAATATATPVDNQTPERVVVREQEVIIAQAAPPPSADNGPADTDSPASTLDTLPQTAGNFSIFPLLGLGLLASGITAVRFATQQS